MGEGSEKLELTARQRYWLGHVQAWTRTGGGMKAYAEAHGLEVKELYHWKRWLGGKGLLGGDGHLVVTTAVGGESIGPRLFERLVVEREQSPAPLCCVVLPNGVRIELGGPLNATLLGAVFKAAGGLS